MRHKLILITLIIASLLALILAVNSWTQAQLSDQEELSAQLSLQPDAVVAVRPFELTIQSAHNTYQVQELVDEPSFKLPENAWQRQGVVNYLSSYQSIQPLSGSRLVMIGDPDNSGFLEENCLSQTIDLTKPTKNLGFYYQLFSSELLESFDQPAFTLKINQQLVWQDSAKTTDWQLGLVNLDYLNPGQSAELEFCAGNTGDDQFSSYVLLDQVSTNLATINADEWLVASLSSGYSGQLKLMTAGQFWQTETEPVWLEFEKPTSQSIQLEYWQDQQLVNQEILPLIVDFDPPPKPEVKLFEGTQGEANFELETDVFQSCQIRYQNEKFSVAKWFELSTLDHQSLPLVGQTQLLYNLSLTEEQLGSYFAVRCYDFAGNWSELSNLVRLTEQSQVDTIYINELVANPTGSDSADWQEGEWVELFNPGQQAVDIAGWKLVDLAENTLIISNANSDNNSNFQDGGETVIKPGEWLTVYKNGSAFLNNSGDQLSLFNSNQDLVDQVEYPSQIEGFSCGRLPGQEGWFNQLIPSPLAVNQQ
ncbi:MAG: hypothetical protein GF381_01450 [Candidatus Pacebacteria bacterium]|nr:hypothetical protein [Candidatus Paceibacterota bacterium]